MTTYLRAGVTYTFNAFADIPSFARYEATGRSIQTVRQNVANALASIATGPISVRGEVSRNPVLSDSLNLRITMTPANSIDSGSVLAGRPFGLSEVILNGANAGTDRSIANILELFTAHQPRGTVSGVLSSVFLAGSALSEMVVDPSSVIQGADDMPPPSSSSALGRAVQGLAGSTTASPDPARDGQPTGRNNETLVPWYVYAGGVAAGAVVLAITVGYVARAFK